MEHRDFSLSLASDSDSEDAGFFDEVDLINDLETMTVQDVDLPALYQEVVACKQLLGLIVAILIVYMIYGVMMFFYKLVTRNITNYF